MAPPTGHATAGSRQRPSEQAWSECAEEAEHTPRRDHGDDVEPPFPEREQRECREAESDRDPVDRATRHERDLRERDRDREDETHDSRGDAAQELLQSGPRREPVHVPSGGEHEKERREEEPEGRERGAEPWRAHPVSREEADEDADRDERARSRLPERERV